MTYTYSFCVRAKDIPEARPPNLLFWRHEISGYMQSTLDLYGYSRALFLLRFLLPAPTDSLRSPSLPLFETDEDDPRAPEIDGISTPAGFKNPVGVALLVPVSCGVTDGGKARGGRERPFPLSSRINI